MENLIWVPVALFLAYLFYNQVSENNFRSRLAQIPGEIAQKNAAIERQKNEIAAGIKTGRYNNLSDSELGRVAAFAHPVQMSAAVIAGGGKIEDALATMAYMARNTSRAY